MANIVAADVTYTLIKKRVYRSRKHNLIKLVFGDGALTYPAGGIPLSKGNLGCPNDVESLSIVDQGTSGYKFSYDRTNNKLVVTQNAAHAHNLLIKGGQAAASTAATAYYATDIFGKEAATDKTILGVDSATKGGVIASTSLANSEASAVAIAAQTIYVEVIGW